VARLLATHDIGLEDEPVLAEQNGSGRHVADQRHAFMQPEQLRALARHVAAEAQHERGGMQKLAEQRQQRRQVGQPCGGVELEDERVAVAVEHQAGHAVVLAMDDPVPGGVAGGEHRPPTIDRGLDLRPPPRRVDRGRLAVMQHADADR
jgi:hypothetical protein